MTTARCKIVDLDVTRYYHCISRCVRGAHLCGNGLEHRKQWLEDRLELLATCFAVSVAGFSVMDNHIHVLVRLDPRVAAGWTDEKVVQNWLSVYPPRGLENDNPSSHNRLVKKLLADKKRVAVIRSRLANMGWFMKALKEPLSRIANREDGCRGAFWEGRYKSIAILDEEALLATCAYIDLNPVAAGMASNPESSKHTSVRQRVRHIAAKGKQSTLRSAKKGSVESSRRVGNAEQDHWLIPFEDRRSHTNAKPESKREGMLDKFTLGHYLQLVDYSGRIFRKGKASLAKNLRDIFDRLETSVEFWTIRLKNMLVAGKLRGRCFAVTPKSLAEANQRFSNRAMNLSSS